MPRLLFLSDWDADAWALAAFIIVTIVGLAAAGVRELRARERRQQQQLEETVRTTLASEIEARLDPLVRQSVEAALGRQALDLLTLSETAGNATASSRQATAQAHAAEQALKDRTGELDALLRQATDIVATIQGAEARLEETRQEVRSLQIELGGVMRTLRQLGRINDIEVVVFRLYERDWSPRAQHVCELADPDDRVSSLDAIGDELVETFALDIGIAASEFPETVLKPWGIAMDAIVGLYARTTGHHNTELEPARQALNVDLAKSCIASLKSNVCNLAQNDPAANLQGRVRRICFETVISDLRRILGSID
jgi:hypothetical protein